MGLQKYWVHAWIGNIHWRWQPFSQYIGWYCVSIQCGKRTCYPEQLSAFIMGSRTQTLFHTAQNCSLVYQRPANLTMVLKYTFCKSFNYCKSIWSLWGFTHSWFLFTVKGQWMVNKSCKQFSITPDGFLCKMTECNNDQQWTGHSWRPLCQI